MIPFPRTEDPHLPSERAEGSSFNTNSSKATTASDKLSALPQPSSSSPGRHHVSPSLSNSKRIRRRSLDGSLLNFPSLPVSESEISPLRRLRDKFGTHRSHEATPRASVSEGSSPNRRRTGNDDDHSRSKRLSIGHIFSHLRTGSDSPLPPSGLRSAAYATDGDTTHHGPFDSRSPSHSPSRAISPFRFIQNISAGLYKQHRPEPEEPFEPINPFKSKINFNILTCFVQKPPAPDIELSAASDSSNSAGVQNCEDVLMVTSVEECFSHGHLFVTDVMPRFVYLILLLGLPALYFSRVARIFKEAEVSRPDIRRMIETGQSHVPGLEQYDDLQHLQHRRPESGKERGDLSSVLPHHPLRAPGVVGITIPAVAGQPPVAELSPTIVTPTLLRFKHSWEAFIDSLLREWKTLNVVSALLASAILTIFQIPSAASDPLTRTAAILSLICSLMSLTYGCMYIVRFGSMRTMMRASKWAEEARKTKTSILWNVWVLLAMPAVWLAWSMVIFMVTILSFVWRTGSDIDPPERPPLNTTAILGPRIAITVLVLVGLVYLGLIIKTLKSYGLHGGNSQSMLSPARRLSALGANRQGHAARTDHTGDQGAIGESSMLDATFERRGRERQRSASFGNGAQRREEISRMRDQRRGAVEVGERSKKEERSANALGFHPLGSDSSPYKIV